MNIDIFTGGSTDDASDYTFSNLYFHPDFLSSNADPVIKQVFAGTRPGTDQPNEDSEDTISRQEEEKEHE